MRTRNMKAMRKELTFLRGEGGGGGVTPAPWLALRWSLLFGLLSVGAWRSAAVPEIPADGVRLSQRPGTSQAIVEYELLNEDAIVTLDICTNGVSIGYENIRHLVGDVNRLVHPGSTRRIKWNVHKSWPGRLLTDGGVTAVVTAWATNCPPDYLVADLSGATTVCYYPASEAVPGGVTNDLYKTEKLLMRKIPAANALFRRGSPAKEVGRDGGNYERAHLVSHTNDYWMGVYPVTQAQYRRVSGKLSGVFTNDAKSATYPLNGVSIFMLRGSNLETTKKRLPTVAQDSLVGCFRQVVPSLPLDIPTDAQWEYACRAGSYAALYNGRDLVDSTSGENLDAIAWHAGNSEGRPHAVGEKQPNAFGLYDMLGNVREATFDLYYPFGAAPQCDPFEPWADGQNMRASYRGGSFADTAAGCRSAKRYGEFDWNLPSRTSPESDQARCGVRLMALIP